MKIARLKELLNEGHEFEFDYKGKRYSLTWSDVENDVIAFCEFYKEDIESKNIDEILNATYNGMKVSDIIEELNEEEIDIF